MKNIEEQLSQYKSVHFNKMNIKTHFIGVPLIIWAVTLLLSLNVYQLNVADISFTYTPAYVFFAVSLIYYFILHVKLAIAMVFYSAINLYLVSFVADHEHALYIALVVFFIGWVFQFVGHYYEKAKPAFIDDLGQFLIAPLFLMAEVYFLLGWEKTLEETITPMAVSKRRKLNNPSHG
ncbi:DUF962 domain-containing protein [Pseudocolwellia agarivorans]|uniref:Mpo1 family 2-hydroxy fatty acid dioxygenase n=1 Tax=Pseudocolwellia agarivorans TaxID=1911682 RepID=UPI000984FDB1|nr:Mpo1-like protein [Pseudocolwellia agarivorans]